ncbi:replication initiator protein A [Rhodopirellula bahusiensis]|uniref:replication initiator protein A n=1 Tax=Rhodopirellula bahusiensis TaxID=2014065 RepID=UPI00326797E5
MADSSLTEKRSDALLPNRHPIPDFFICDISDAAPKGDMAGMAFPIFSLSTKPDQKVRRYEHDNNWLEVRPGAEGLATVFDRDILIFAISQLVAAMNAGREVQSIIRFQAIDLLTATNRETSGRGYDLLRSALERLAGTRITTNILTGQKEITRGFGLIEHYEIVRETRDGRMQEIEIKVSDWVYQAVKAKEVLTLHKDFFRLRRPLERRMYELARKHCGRQSEWRISLGLLQSKSGSTSTLKEFKRAVKRVVERDRQAHHMPDYSVELDEGDRDIVVFTNRGSIPPSTGGRAKQDPVRELKPDVYHEARLAAPGWDIRELESQWRDWIALSGAEAPRNPEAAFLGFCRKWSQRRGRA